MTLLYTWAASIESVRPMSYRYYGYRYPRNEAKIGLGAAAVGTVVFVLTFTLWVWACVDCHRYRYSERYPAYRRSIRGEDNVHVAPYPIRGGGLTGEHTVHNAEPRKQENVQPVYA